MSKLGVPKFPPGEPEPSDHSRREITKMEAAERNVLLYERNLEQLNKDIEYLKGKLNESDEERRSANIKCGNYVDTAAKVPGLNEEIRILRLRFIVWTIAMTVGSGLISSNPKIGENYPVWFWIGWVLIVAGATTEGVIPIAAFLLKKFDSAKKLPAKNTNG